MFLDGEGGGGSEGWWCRGDVTASQKHPPHCPSLFHTLHCSAKEENSLDNVLEHLASLSANFIMDIVLYCMTALHFPFPLLHFPGTVFGHLAQNIILYYGIFQRSYLFPT